MNSLRLEDVVVSFKRVRALRGVTVEAKAGEVLMLVGPNGAGKSTLMQVLLGLVRADSGRVVVDERPLKPTSARAVREFREKLGYMPEAVAFSDNLTGRQVLRFFASARGVSKKRIDVVLERIGLTHAARRAVRGYSRGMRQRLGLGVAILAEPELLVMDEPTGGLDQEGLDVLWTVLEEWRERGGIIVMASHDLTLLERRVDQIAVLQQGNLVACGTPADLRASADLPVKVTFDCADERGALREALVDWPVVVDDARGMVIEATTADLLALMRCGANHEDAVKAVRVEEPGLDEVYERLLNKPPEVEGSV